MNSKFLIIPAVIMASILAVFAYDSVNLDNICAESGGIRNGGVCEIIHVYEPPIESVFDFSGIKSMKPNSMEYFYYPNPEDIENRDAFQKFILIRLPEELGGDTDDVSAFRAYSALSVGEHCLVKYWPHEGRKRMEDPCWGSIYRPIDGLLISGSKPVVNTTPVALPYLELSIDENGSMYVEPPVWTKDENGVVGIGRAVALSEIRQNSQILVDAYEKTNTRHPKIPVDFAGQILTAINHNANSVEVRYHEFPSTDWMGITFYINNVSSQDQERFRNLAKSNSEFWQIDNSIIYVGGSAMDKNSSLDDGLKKYEIEFIADGFKFTIVGKNLDLINKAIVANYFPDFSYDDLVLVSSTVKK